MKRLLTLILVCMTVTACALAQGMKVLNFRLLDNDLTASTRGTEKFDQNGERAALVKIVTPERGFTFDGGTLGIVATEEHVGEIWLYVPRRSMKLIVQHPDYGVTRDFNYPIPIEGGRTYEMFIDIGIGRYVTITSQVAKSTIYVDGEKIGESPVHNKYLYYGRHTLRAVKDRFEGERAVLIQADDNASTQIISIDQRDMSDHYGDVTVTVDNRADIYFEGKNVGNGSWQTQLREGNYTIETRKADCDPVKTSFSVVARQQNTVKATPPTPHTGWLSIYTRPHNVQATYNGNRPIDLSETVTLPVGSYQLEFTRKGYDPLRREFKVVRNQTTADTVTLERTKYVKPVAFYFGGGYSVRSMSGATAMLGAVIHGHDVQASYTFGLSASDPVYWYADDGSYDYRSGCSYKLNSIALHYGYQFNLSEKLAITPQLGVSIDQLSVADNDAQQSYADGASATCLTVGLKLLLVPFEHCYLFVAPEYDIAMKKDGNYEKLSSSANMLAGGFVAHLGVLVNF